MYPINFKTFSLIVALLLTGEVLIVAFGPYPPASRKGMVMDLPVIKQAQDWRQDRRIKNAFEEAEDGVIRRKYMGSYGEWDSPEALKADAATGSTIAATTLYSLRNPERYWEPLKELKRRAQQNDLVSMVNYYHTSIALISHEDSLAAAHMLENHPSATAEWALVAFGGNREWFQTREGRLLIARVARENLRYPNMSEENYSDMTEANRTLLRDIAERAEDGDEDARWVVEQLVLLPDWQQPTMN